MKRLDTYPARPFIKWVGGKTQLLDDIKKEDKVYLLVAHNGISRAIESYVRDMSNEEFAGFGIKNCELRKYEF